jgi:hypothetical protein
MQNLTTSQRLDVVLVYLKGLPANIEYIVLLTAMKDIGLVTTQGQLKVLLDKLERDKYALKIIEPGYYDYYIITPEGQSYVGYEEEEKLLNIQNQTKNQDIIDQKSYAGKYLSAMKLAGWGAWGLLAWEVLKVLLAIFQYFCHCEFVWQK